MECSQNDAILRDVHSVEDDTRRKRADAVSGRNDDVACKTLVMTWAHTWSDVRTKNVEANCNVFDEVSYGR